MVQVLLRKNEASKDASKFLGKVKVLVAQLCLTLCDPMGSSVHSPPGLCPWAHDMGSPWAPLSIAHQAPLSMGFCKQECWSELPCPSPMDLPDPGIETGLPTLQVNSLPSEPPVKSQILGYNDLK